MQKKTLISCIDDDVAVRDGIAAFLDASGFDTEFFLSAEEFLKTGRLEYTSCLITDVMLGGMSGLQLQERLISSGRNIPIIIITAFPDDWTRTKALNAGAICFLEKPVRAEDLLAAIDLALKGSARG
ncbi:response regulator transcription factor [Bradyrhizobium sp. McL0616]|uniref:response regulator transcription factor n=1 Tax=Bradyrhizobium sp. McL0616 TaxID=3415674 RepID=UPI003CF0D0A2